MSGVGRHRKTERSWRSLEFRRRAGAESGYERSFVEGIGDFFAKNRPGVFDTGLGIVKSEFVAFVVAGDLQLVNRGIDGQATEVRGLGGAAILPSAKAA